MRPPNRSRIGRENRVVVEVEVMIRLWAARVGDGNSGGFVQIFDELIDGALEHFDHTGLRAANGEGGGRARLSLSHRLTGRSVVTIPPICTWLFSQTPRRSALCYRNYRVLRSDAKQRHPLFSPQPFHLFTCFLSRPTHPSTSQ
jgi:hypothetical protein